MAAFLSLSVYMQTTQLKATYPDDAAAPGWNKNFAVIKGTKTDDEEKKAVSLPVEQHTEQLPQEPVPHFLPAPLNQYIKVPLYDFF